MSRIDLRFRSSRNSISSIVSSPQYAAFNKSDFSSDEFDRLKTLNLVIPSPLDPYKCIIYIGKGKPNWPKLLRFLKGGKYNNRSRSIRDAHCNTQSYLGATITLDKAEKDKRIKRNLKEIKNIAKYLESLSGLAITKYTIMIASKKNGKYCKNGMLHSHIAHYHNRKPGRICFRPIFLVNPLLPTKQKCNNCHKHHVRYGLTLDQKWFKENRKPERCRITSFLALVDCTCHELAHHGTDGGKGGHGVTFQKKYNLLFSTMLDAISSGKYNIQSHELEDQG